MIMRRCKRRISIHAVYGKFFEFGILPNLVCKFIKSELIKRADVKVNDVVRFGEDADACYRYIAKAESIQFLDYAPYHYIKHENTMVSGNMSIQSIKCLYSDLIDAFDNASIGDIMHNQLIDYISFVTLLKCPEEIMDHTGIFKKRLLCMGRADLEWRFTADIKNQSYVWRTVIMKI